MFNRRNIIYLYDGTFEGLLTAVFISFENHEIPMNIEVDADVQQTLEASYFYVASDNSKALRVENSIRNKITPVAYRKIYLAFLSNAADKEMKILAYIHRCFKYGKSVNSHLNDKYVADILNAAQYVVGEAHRHKGYIRFSELDGGILYGEISPENRILPCLILHFTERYPTIPFMINDLVHKECLVYNGKECVIRDTFSEPQLCYSNDEMQYRKLWKEFYDTVEIKERHNERCRMNYMPKKYWKHITEMAETIN